MAPSPASGSGKARAAVVGAETREGAHVRGTLESLKVPGARVNLYGTTQGEAVISEYAGEARLMQDPNLPEIVAHDVIFLCETGKLAENVVAHVSPDSVVIDVSGALDESRHPRLVHLTINPDTARGHDGFLAVGHPLAIVLAELLYGLDRECELIEATACVIRPAADFGDEGVEELREQTVRLLNFNPVPTLTFGQQLAFNLLPGDETRVAQLEQRVGREVQSLLGWDEPRLSVATVTAPVFHGHGIQLHFRLGGERTTDEVRSALLTGGFLESAGNGGSPTPLSVAESSGTLISEPREDGLGGFWLWVVAGDAGVRCAQQAVGLAGLVSDL